MGDDPIQEMQDAVEELRGVVDGFDLDVHNDEGNEMKVADIRAQLDNLESAIDGLVP